MEVVLPNKVGKLVKFLKKEVSTRILCKFENVNGITFFVIGNGKCLACIPYLLKEVKDEEGPFTFEFKILNKYHCSFILSKDPNAFNYKISQFFNKEIVKSFTIELSYRKERILFEFVKNFNDIFSLDILNILCEMLEREVIFCKLDNEIYMVTEYDRYQENPFQSCKTKLFFTGIVK